MKRLLLIVGCLLMGLSSFAGHIAGGEVYYKYLGPGTTQNTNKYEITLRLFRECNPPPGQQQTADLPTSVIIGVFNNSSPSSLFSSTTVNRTAFQTITLAGQNPCIVNPPDVCYQVGYYSFEQELPVTAAGYLISFQSCCRTNNIANVANNGIGATYVAEIPGTAILNQQHNTSAVFTLKDTTLICKFTDFTLDFSATDADGDSLSYTLCSAFDGGPTTNSTPVTPSNPPYATIGYASGFSGSQSLGNTVSINPTTGLISGKSPAAGAYVVNVCVTEWRNGQPITIHRKDFTLKIGDCSTTKPDLGPDDRTCNGFDFVFSNTTTGQFTSYLWNFGDNSTSTVPQPSHTYTNAGLYTVKLKITADGGCQDSSSKQVYVFPGFVPKFTIAGSCYLNPYQFTNTTFTAYGTVDTTKWNFGDPTTLADTSNLPNPTYQYATVGTYPIRLYATNTKGCRKDTLMDLVVADKPQIQMPFRDTLICSIDTLILHANANGGSYAWTPNTPNVILNPNSPNPSVFPKDTTMFIVTVNNNGCINKDTVVVNVLDFIDVFAGLDTAICRTDTFRLHPTSHALSYLWTASTGENVASTKYPLVQPLVHTMYYVKANLGKCQDSDSVYVKVAPYPQVNAADVGPLCYGKSIQLTANIVGSNFSWTPTTNILNANTLTPVVSPLTTTNYILSVTDTVGCPKPVKDTVRVFVVPPVTAFAGKDTSVVINQPLRLFVFTNAPSLSASTHYQWSPNTWLNNDTIQNPIATINTIADSIRYMVTITTADGCIGSDDIVVKVFKTEPDIFVPTGFTPNKDGKNDILKPICVGISRLEYFRVFNRWGQMIYTTSEIGQGWDGRVSGTDQDTGTYVFMAQGVDYTGKVVFRKGTVVLIR